MTEFAMSNTVAQVGLPLRGNATHPERKVGRTEGYPLHMCINHKTLPKILGFSQSFVTQFIELRLMWFANVGKLDSNYLRFRPFATMIAGNGEYYV